MYLGQGARTWLNLVFTLPFPDLKKTKSEAENNQPQTTDGKRDYLAISHCIFLAF